MKFGATFLAHPPSSRIVDLAVRAEAAGFDYVFVNDCDTLFEDPWPIFALIAKETERVRIGPCVTNPVNRDWSVLAGLIATLDEMSGGRMVCGIGRGDAAVRTLGLPPASVRNLEECIAAIRALVSGRSARYGGGEARLQWVRGRELEVWGAAYGPKVLQTVGRSCDGCLIQAADEAMLRWALPFVRAGAEAAGRDPGEVQVMAGAPAYVSEDAAHAHDQLRWFAASVANHVAALIRRYGDRLPVEIRDIAKGRVEYDYATKGKAGSKSSAFVTDELNTRLCLIGAPEEHMAKLKALEAAGVDVYTIYFNHDAIEQTMDAYGEEIIPAFRS